MYPDSISNIAMALTGMGITWSCGLAGLAWRRGLFREPERINLKETPVESPKAVPQMEWLAVRKALLAMEKELSHLRDEISRQRHSQIEGGL